MNNLILTGIIAIKAHIVIKAKQFSICTDRTDIRVTVDRQPIKL